MISSIIEMSLATMNYTAVVAENGKIAVDRFNEFMNKGFLFELILMDIIMPEMGGYESTQLIRKSEELF
jgi:CheY-like chemotaxis protein